MYILWFMCHLYHLLTPVQHEQLSMNTVELDTHLQINCIMTWEIQEYQNFQMVLYV